jgi:hypothetical protein
MIWMRKGRLHYKTFSMTVEMKVDHIAQHGDNDLLLTTTPAQCKLVSLENFSPPFPFSLPSAILRRSG